MSVKDAGNEFERRLAEDRKRIQELQAERARETAAQEAAARAEQQRKAQEALEMLGAQGKAGAKAEKPALPAVHVVQSGDTLSAIALKYYGNAALWTEIYKTNKRVIGNDPAKIFPGQELKIPRLG